MGRSPFLDDTQIEIYGVEALAWSADGLHAASIARQAGVLHGNRTIC